MSWIQRKVFCLCVFAMAIAAAAPGSSASAQDANIRSVSFYTVKPDRIGDFQAEIKEYDALLAKGGSTTYSTTWVSLTGPRVYAHVILYTKWADLDAGADPKMKDQAADLARVNMRIIDCTESWSRTIEEVVPELSLPNTNTMPKMIRVLVTDVRPDKYNEYLDLQKNEILPAVKKSGAAFYNLAETRYGNSNLEVTSVTGFDSWADLDAGIGAQKGLGTEGY
ncbi:MAG: hypothetical protein WBC92_07930, partial [Terracidiphilus sp.]